MSTPPKQHRKRSWADRYRPERLFYLLLAPLILSVPANLLQSFIVQGPDSIAPSQWAHLYIFHMALTYPIPTAVIGLLAIALAIYGFRLDQRRQTTIAENDKQARLIEAEGQIRPVHDIVQGVADRQNKQGEGLQQIIEQTAQIQHIVTQSTVPLIPVREIKPATLNLGDDQSATFPYLPTIFPEVYEQATQIFCAALADTQQRGLLVTGAPMAGKTRLAYQTMCEFAPDWNTLTWTRGLTAAAIPTPQTLTGQRIILFLDDLQQYADSETSGDDAGAANEFPLDRLYITLMQNAVQVIIVATCRATDLSRAETTSSLRWLFERVQVVAIPFLPDDQRDAVVGLLKATRPMIDYHHEDFDSTVGSLLLGLSRKREQYLALKAQHHPGYLVLCAMKLLNLAGITQQSKERVRAAAIQALGARMLSDDFKWNTTCEDLEERQFLTSMNTGLLIRKDVYFNKVITDFPTQLRDALLQARRVFQTESDSEALIALGWIFSKRKAIDEMLETGTMAVELAPANARAHYLQGATLSSLLRNKEALVCIDQALVIDPTYAAAWNNKGFVLDALQRYDEAFTAYEEAIKLNPQYTRAWYNKGVVLGWLNRYEEALAAFEKTTKLDSQFADAWFNKGVILRKLSREKEAQTAFEEALTVTTLNPSLVTGWNNKGAMLASLDRSEEALAAYDIAIKLNPQDAGASWFNKGKVLYGLGRFEEVLACFDKALALDPQDADAWGYKGGALNWLQRFEEAIVCYDKNLAINPQEVEAWNGKGDALSWLECFEEALVCYDQALALDPQYLAAMSSKAFVLNELKRYEETLECCDQALAIDPQYPNPLRHKGNAQRGLHRYEEALACFDKALVLNPQYGEAWYNKGAVLRQLERAEEALVAYDKAIALTSPNTEAEDYEEALEAYDEAIRLNPQNAEMWHKKGIVLGKLGRDEEVLAAYDEVNRLEMQGAIVWYDTGMTLDKLGRAEDALAAYDEAIKLEPEYGSAWYKKGTALGVLSRHEEALAAYDEALKWNPQNAEAWHNKGATLDKLGRAEEAWVAYDEANKLKVRPASNRSFLGSGKRLSPDAISEEYLDAEIVMNLQSTNMFGDPVYSYLRINGRNLKRLLAKMGADENFKPADFGIVLAAGHGDPPQDVRDEMNKEYEMREIPAPTPSLQPKFLDDEDI